jgi:serralysin
VAVQGSAQDDVVFNVGTISGTINLGNGADAYLGPIGRLTGQVNGGPGNDSLSGGIDNVVFFGGDDDDSLRGNDGNDQLNGENGIDLLEGLAGNDTLSGGANNDVLNGGLGRDTLTGGLNNDFFVFNAPLTAAHRDTIADFNRVADTMRLENAVFKGIGGNGVLAASMFKLSTQAKDANDRIIYNKASGAVAFDADGSGAKAAIVFATLVTKPTITNADFVVI